MPARRLASRRLLAAASAFLVAVVGLGLGPGTEPASAAPPVRTLPLTKIALEHGSQMRDVVQTKRRIFVSKLDQLWVLNPDGSVHRKIKGPSGAGDLTLSPDGKRLYMVSAPGLYVWDTRTLKVLQRVELDICSRNIVLIRDRIFYAGGRHCQTIKSVGALRRGHAVPTGIQADGPVILAGGGSTLVVTQATYLPGSGPFKPRLMSYRVRGSELVALASVERPGDVISRIVSDREGRRVYVPTPCCAAQVTAYRATTLRRGATYTADSVGVLSSVAVSPDGRTLALGIDDADVDVVGFEVGTTSPAWSARTTRTDEYRPRGVPETLGYSEDGKHLLLLMSEQPRIRGRVAPLYLSSIKA